MTKFLHVALAVLAIARAETLYVSTEGRAGAPGTKSAPLPTLAAARDRIRELRRSGAAGAMTVLVRGGAYFLDEPFVLTPEDSGTKAQPVTYAAYPGERAILSGGRRITGWTKKDNRVWTAPAGFEFRQLFVGGKRVMRARSPNQGFYRIEGRVMQEKPMLFKYQGDTFKKSWAERGDVEVTVLCAWQEARGRITAVDEAAHTVLLAANTPAPAGRTQAYCYYSIDNAPESLDYPLEWYLDRKAGVVSYLARAEDPSQEEVIAPVLEQLVKIKGEPESGKLVHDVVFRGLDFRHSAWSLPDNGYLGMQAASTVPAAFDAEGAENISVDHCMFAQLGNYAISFGRGCFRNRVVSNEMEDLGGGGVKIGEPTMNRQRPNEAERNGNNQVADNHMHRLGLVYPASVGVLLGQSSDNTVSHNHIHDLTYSAISVGWTWQYKLTQLKNNIIEYNHLHDLGHNVMSDMGGIYTLGEQPGTVLRNNLIHDVNALVYGGWGIYLDQATSNIVVEKNVVYKNASGLKILSRKSYEESAGSVFDNPLASRFDENDAVLYFDEVKVPWERVFIAGDIAMCQKQFFATPAHVFQNYQCQIRLMVKLRFLVGLARKIAIINGIDTFPQVRETLGQLAAEAASVEAFVAAMEVKGAPWRTYFVPDRHMLYASQVLTQQLYPKVIHTLRELAGGSMIMLPSGIEDFSDPQISDYVLRAQGSAAVCPKDRVKFFKLAWDAVGSEFASRHTQYEMFYAGAGFVTKGHSHRTYNWEAATGLVDRLLSTYDFPRDVSPAPELTNAR